MKSGAPGRSAVVLLRFRCARTGLLCHSYTTSFEVNYTGHRHPRRAESPPACQPGYRGRTTGWPCSAWHTRTTCCAPTRLRVIAKAACSSVFCELAPAARLWLFHAAGPLVGGLTGVDIRPVQRGGAPPHAIRRTRTAASALSGGAQASLNAAERVSDPGPAGIDAVRLAHCLPAGGKPLRHARITAEHRRRRGGFHLAPAESVFNSRDQLGD